MPLVNPSAALAAIIGTVRCAVEGLARDGFRAMPDLFGGPSRSAAHRERKRRSALQQLEARELNAAVKGIVADEGSGFGVQGSGSPVIIQFDTNADGTTIRLGTADVFREIAFAERRLIKCGCLSLALPSQVEKIEDWHPKRLVRTCLSSM